MSKILGVVLVMALSLMITSCDEFINAIYDNPVSSCLTIKTEKLTVKVGETVKCKFTVSTMAVMKFQSADTSIATVDDQGNVTGVKEGKTTITLTVTTYDANKTWKNNVFSDASATIDVEVIAADAEEDEDEETKEAATPLTMEAITAGTIVVAGPQSGMQYSLNGGAKQAVSTTAIDVAKGDKVQFYGNGTAITSYYGTTIAGGTAEVKVYGNIMSLVDETGFATNTTLTAGNTFNSLFIKNDKLKDASGLLLPAETLTESCYSNMFNACTSLTAAPALPATSLANSCYNSMFYGCTSLTTAPALTAETLAENCYQHMFQNCTSLTAAPELNAQTLAENCYQYMFQNCKTLTAAPALPATSLANSCYSAMFQGCTSLTTAPELKAETLAEYCYSYMFYGCKALTTAPELKAETLAKGCYFDMFHGCTKLTTAPALPAKTLANDCYNSMFYGCTSLETAPKLPAETLAKECYYYMFYNCTALTTAYVKAAYTTANDECYKMFEDCTATGAKLHTTAANKDDWETVMGSTNPWNNWTVEDNWTD